MDQQGSIRQGFVNCLWQTHPRFLFVDIRISSRSCTSKIKNLLHLNPGAAGIHGFHQIRTMLRFEIHDGKLQNMEVIELGKRGKG